MLQHPAIHWRNASPFIFQSLVRTWVEPGLYWLDLITPQSRLRLTNLNTGEYVIYGDLSPIATEKDVFVDEQLRAILPRRRMRLKIGENTFQHFSVQDDLPYLAGRAGTWAMDIQVVDGSVRYNTVSIATYEAANARLAQFVILDKVTRLEYETVTG